MKTDRIKKMGLFLYKSITYIFTFIIYLIVFSKSNYALLKITRTSIITTVAYFGSMILMQTIYGGLSIGEEKSKPIILSTVLSLFFVNIITVVVLYIMGINEFSFRIIFWRYFLSIVVVFFLQTLLIWGLVHLGNYLFFKFNKPAKTILIYDNSKLANKVENYIKSYDKQYEFVGKYYLTAGANISLENIDQVYLLTADSYATGIIKECVTKNIDLTYNATIQDVSLIKSNFVVIDDILMIHVTKRKSNITQSVVKRLMDIVISIIALVLTLPITIITAIAIKVEDGGKVFFIQDRLTKNGKVFQIIKFRSMVENTSNEPVKVDDERITNVGYFIRKYRIDELPQFINIFKGDMSVVGPRPESLSQFNKISKDLPEFGQRLAVKGGLTGYAQIFGKYNTSPKQKLILDLKYINNFNIFEDIKLLFQTLIVFFKKDSTEAFS